MADPRRGEIWLADLRPTRGREQTGRWPVLVLSVDFFNSGSADLIVVLPLTLGRARYSTACESPKRRRRSQERQHDLVRSDSLCFEGSANFQMGHSFPRSYRRGGRPVAHST